jgi:hypothetical protein
VSRISYRLSAGQTKRAARNWVSHLLPDMIDKSPPSVISAKLLFRRAAARAHPVHTFTSSYSSSNHWSTATCLSVRCSRMRVAVAACREKCYFLRKLFDQFLLNKNSQRKIITEMFHIANKGISTDSNSRVINVNFFIRIKDKIFAFTVIFGLNSLAISLSAVHRAKGKLG